MKMSVSGKVAIVTGGAKGIGCACVKSLLKNNAKYVAIFDIILESPAIEKFKEEFGTERLDIYNCDVSNQESFESNFVKVEKKHGNVDILINSAGFGNENDAAKVIDVNVKGTILANLTAIEHMGNHKGGKGGVIMNVASITGLLDCHVLPVFSASKHAVVSFTRSMKRNCQEMGVRILAVCPGQTKTDFDTELADRKSKNFLNFVRKVDIINFHQFRTQSTDHVSNAIVQLIKEGDAGTVWVVEHDEESYKISSMDHYTQRIISSHEAAFFCG